MTAFLKEIIDDTLMNIGDEPITTTLSKTAARFNQSHGQDDRLYLQALREIESFGPIEELMVNDQVTEILINGPDQIYYEYQGRLIRHVEVFSSRITLKRMIGRLLMEMEKTADQRTPFVDGSLKNGFRVHIALPPVASDLSVCIRKHCFSRWTLQDLENFGMYDTAMHLQIKKILSERKNVLVCGATSSGKTTLLRAMINELPLDERIVIIEDTQELGSSRPGVVALLTRESSENLIPQISMNDLLKNSLRMRPDRLVVGEVRGIEALTLADALSTGHSGSLCTLHAGNASQALIRLEGLISRAAPNWQQSTIRQLIFESLDVVLVLEKQNGLRKITQAVEVTGFETFGYLLEPLKN